MQQTHHATVILDAVGKEAHIEGSVLTEAEYLVAGHSLLMLVVLSEHVSKAPPGGCIRVVNAQGLAVTLLGGLPPHLPLRSP